MKAPQPFELPPELQSKWKKASIMEWITIFYLSTVIVLMFLVMGSSQAMKTAWLEDMLSTLPAISFLIAGKFYNRPATKKFPYGYHRIFSIAFLAGSIALLSIGSFLLIDGSMSLIKGERPTIGSIFIWGHQIWMGWLMILVLVWSSVPAVILGRLKLPIAKAVHNKILYADADTQKADYMTAIAAMCGVLGIGLGFWWADAVTAVLISLSVIKDGFKNTKNAILDIMDRHPVQVDHQKLDPLVETIQHEAKQLEYIKDAQARMREHGQVYFGEVFVVPNTTLSSEQIEQMITHLREVHWRIQDVVVVEVKELPGFPG